MLSPFRFSPLALLRRIDHPMPAAHHNPLLCNINFNRHLLLLIPTDHHMHITRICTWRSNTPPQWQPVCEMLSQSWILLQVCESLPLLSLLPAGNHNPTQYQEGCGKHMWSIAIHDWVVEHDIHHLHLHLLVTIISEHLVFVHRYLGSLYYSEFNITTGWDALLLPFDFLLIDEHGE